MSANLKRSSENNIWKVIPATREALTRVKLKALRYGIWFKELSRDERILMELVIRVTDRVVSFLLANLLSRIIKKLVEAMGGVGALMGKVAYTIKMKGLYLAQKVSAIAQGWGNKSASRWIKEQGFIQYLTIMRMNNP